MVRGPGVRGGRRRRTRHAGTRTRVGAGGPPRPRGPRPRGSGRRRCTPPPGDTRSSTSTASRSAAGPSAASSRRWPCYADPTSSTRRWRARPVTDWRALRHALHRAVPGDARHRRRGVRPALGCSTTRRSSTRPLLLIHGLADDNVYVANTAALSKALMEAGRFHSVIPLSGITHAPSQPEVAENLLLLQVRFLRDALGLRPIRPEAAATLARIANGGPLEHARHRAEVRRNLGRRRRADPSRRRPGGRAPKRTGYDVVVAVSAMGDTTDELLAMAQQIAPVPNPRELDMLLTAGERIAMSLLAIAINARGCQAAVVHGLAGRHHHRHAARRRRTSSRSGPSGILESWRRATSSSSPASRAFHALRHHHARPWRLRHHRRGDGGRARSRGLRDLHRRAGRVHRRPPDRAGRAEAPGDLATRRCSSSPPPARRSCSSRSVEYARRHGVKLHVRSSFERRARHVGAGGGRTQMEGVLISGVALDDDEAKVTLDRVPDRPGRRGDGLPRDRRRGHQRRHDRAERVARRRHRPVVHRPARRPPAAAVGHGRVVKESTRRGSRSTTGSRRCRSWARG